MSTLPSEKCGHGQGNPRNCPECRPELFSSNPCNELLAEALRSLARGYSTEGGRDTLLRAARIVASCPDETSDTVSKAAQQRLIETTRYMTPQQIALAALKADDPLATSHEHAGVHTNGDPL